MRYLLCSLTLLLALQAGDCSASASKPAPIMPETGREAMRVDGQQSGRLEKQDDGTYLLRYPDKTTDRVSANEVVLMPKGE